MCVYVRIYGIDIIEIAEREGARKRERESSSRHKNISNRRGHKDHTISISL